MSGIRAELVERVDSPDGPQADVRLIEPNGDEHTIRCLCRFDGTTDLGIGGDGSDLAYLNDKYGDQVIWALTRQVTLGNS